MKSFFKSYIIMLIILAFLTVGVKFYLFNDVLGNTISVLDVIIHTIVYDVTMHVALMFVVALPFFILVTKFTQFSAIYSIAMWFLVFLCNDFASQFLFDDFLPTKTKSLWIASVFVGVIYQLIYNAFKKREKVTAVKVDGVFE
ncbi:hypothetical protein [Bartonella sp. HY038]|uniref:hypothetical protein n=1 Tax=Bartonella sp. HY038 TaxID=2759660 RepID=UPI0015FD1D55|nr:hypothetical protein [Bartonella sp. HY038]